MRLLFVKLRHIGDALLLTPTLAAVKQVMPRSEIWVVVRRGSEGILAGCPHIDQLRTAMIPEQGGVREAHRGADAGLLGELRRAGFEHAFELGGGDRGRWLVSLSGARGRTAHTTAAKFPKIWKRAFNRPSRSFRHGYHEVQRDYLVVRDVLALPDEIPPLRFDPGATKPWPAADGLAEFAVIHPSTRWPQKAWSEENWIATGEHLLQGLANVVISTGPDPEEASFAARIASALGDRALTTRGATSWAQLAGLLHRASLFVGVDTAAMHLAAACDCPTVALFGPSKIYEWRPWRVRHRVVRPQDWLEAERMQKLAPDELMKQIDVPRVTAACDEVLAGGGMRAPADSILVVPG